MKLKEWRVLHSHAIIVGHLYNYLILYCFGSVSRMCLTLDQLYIEIVQQTTECVVLV